MRMRMRMRMMRMVGNEIDTPDFTGRALAMEAAAAKLGKGGILRYACPANCGDDEIINASFAGDPPLAERVYVDVHVRPQHRLQ